ncbi:hypothetical protein LDENG_00162130 [Lucifuga dentata]|nr:hypothetical protein LDENG_00162130 [Lucifuga dentata]
MRYLMRQRLRRFYTWRGKPLSFDRKLKTYEYGSLMISVEGLPRTTVIHTGQHILIEGEDEDNPYVAKVIKLFGDERGQQKKALVRWFVRVSEVPLSKLKLLQRAPHPQEIFYFEGRSYEDEVDVESILSTVQVKHLAAAAAFPDGDRDSLYVKLCWDSKTFKVLDSFLMEGGAKPAPASSPVSHPKPSLPPSPPCSPPTAALASRDPSRRALPTPDPAVLRRAAMSTGKAGAAEAESLHSTSKMSASKCLSAKRRSAVSRTPDVCKKLQLSSPGKTVRMQEDVLSQLLDEDLRSEVVVCQRPLSPLLSHLTPIRKTHGPAPTQDAILLKTAVINKTSISQMDSPLSPAGDTLTRAMPSRKTDSLKALKEPPLGVLTETDDEDCPVLLGATTPRSSKRKSAQVVSSRIRKQLKLLDSQQELDADDDFVLSKKELQSSSEEEDGQDEEVEDSDDEVAKRRRRGASRTSRSTRSITRTPRRTPSKKATPSTPRTPRTPRHATPSIPSRSLPARRPANVLEEARARLHVAAVPESLPCREAEFQDIYSFVESKIVDGTGGCMYISGVPGTGKTATVHEVMRCLQHAADMDEIPPFQFIEINGMKMTDPHQAYVQILQKLTGQKVTADHAATLLEKRFSSTAPRQQSAVLLVDELDLLWTRKQNVMYNLFDWPTRRHARLVVLTIANTMDLPERIMMNRVASRLGLTRMSFQPYSFKQLQQIVASRLSKLKAFEDDALQLVSRKVAALSGDARRCLDICRRATEICEHAATEPSATGLVGMSHVMEALNEMFSSAYITAIKCASVQEQLFLRAVIAEFRRLGLEEATFQQVLVQQRALSRVEGLRPLGVSEALAACRRLGACRLLLLESSRMGILQRVRLNVSQDDVLYALKAE